LDSRELLDLIRIVVQEESFKGQQEYTFFNDFFWAGIVETVDGTNNTATILLPNQTIATDYKQNKTSQALISGDGVLLFSPYGTLGSSYIAVANKQYVTTSGGGVVESVAGKIGAVTLVKADVGLSNVDNTSDTNKPISTVQQTALNLKANLASPTFTGTIGGISKSMVGLSSVDNTSDTNKPVSTAQQTALNLKANLASPTFTGTVGGISKSMVGLGNVDNTTDLLKPISTATQTALNLKASLISPTFTGTVGGITKTMVGLSNVDNTSDSSKPISTAQQTALNLKANLANPTFTGTVGGITKTMVGLGSVDNTSDVAKPVSTATQTALNLKANSSQVLTNVPTGALFTDTVYTHPVNHPPSIIAQDTNNRFVTDIEKSTWNGKQSALGFTPENITNKGAVNGYAGLGADGLVPSAQLPSYVDDVLEVSSFATLPATGETGKIYVTLDTNKTYRWSGSAYVYITSGAVDSVAGKTGIVVLAKADVGLSNVDNTTDVAKPVSTAQQTALNLKANLISPTFTGTVGGITKAMVGLSNVNNTTDALKPISTATQTALNLKANLASPTFTGTVSGITKAMVGLGSVEDGAEINNISDVNATDLTNAGESALHYHNSDRDMNNMVEGATTKILTASERTAISTNSGKISYTDATKVSGIESGAQVNTVDSVSGKTGVVTLVKADVGLANVDNTTDALKPVSTATQTALNLKANTSSLATVATTGNYVDLSNKPLDDNFHSLTSVSSTIGGDEFLIYDSTNLNYKKISRTNLFTSVPSEDYVIVYGKQEFTATLGQTIFTLTSGSYTTNSNRMNLYIWGTKQPSSAFTETSTTSITLDVGIDEANTKVMLEWTQFINVMDFIHASNHAVGGTDPLTKAMIGLGNVDNTSDTSKPVSTAQQTALNLKANLASPTFTGTVGGINKSMVGLSNVDNTTDALKPVSTAQQTALNGKVDDAQVLTNVPTGALFTDTIYTHPINHPPSIITQDTNNRFVTDAEKTSWNGKASISVATTVANGLMASSDKTKLDGVEAGATADQTASEILNAIKTVDGAGSGLDADLLDGQGSAYYSPLTTVTTHTGSTSNPHIVTKAQVGLSNADNTTDVAKPVSTATQTALNLKANLASPTFTGTIGGISKSMVGLGNVDNTSDAAKPVSTAQQTALNLKQNSLGFVPENTANKGVVNGYASLGSDGKIFTAQLPSYVDDVLEFANLASFPATGESGKIYIDISNNKTYRWSGTVYVYITSGAVDSVSGKTGVVTLVKGDVGLSNVDNTTDVAKPVSTAQQTALNLKANLASPTFTGTVGGISNSMVGLGNVDNTTDALKPVSTATQTALNLKANLASPTFTGTVGGISKSMIGLSNVDNTSDVAKPISTATQTALNLKANLANPTFTGTVGGVSRAMVGLGSVDNTSDASKNVLSATKLTTARTIGITGDITATAVAFDGSASIAISASVNNDSHTHNNTTITGIEAPTPSTVVQRNSSGEINATGFNTANWTISQNADGSLGFFTV